MIKGMLALIGLGNAVWFCLSLALDRPMMAFGNLLVVMLCGTACKEEDRKGE